jgi:hypothetical protein
VKLFPIVDPSLGEDFFNTHLKVHWSRVKVVYEEVTQEKMVNVVTIRMDPQEKVEWLKIWNGDQII